MRNHPKTACIISTNFCLQSMAQVSHLKDYFEVNNCKVITNFKKADLIILDTCAFTKDLEDIAIKKITQIQLGKKLGAKVIVSGCLPGINKERLAEVFTGHSFSNDKLDDLSALLEFPHSYRDVPSNALYRKMYANHPLTRNAIREVANVVSLIGDHCSQKIKVCLRHLLWFDYDWRSFYIKTGSGCSSSCTYCAIRFARGTLKSRPLEEIMREFKLGLEKGYRDFVLLGDDIGSYGMDIGLNIATVLQEMLKIKGDYKIALSYLNPAHLINMFSPLKQIFQSNRISFMLCPVQSGSNRILKLMNRGYLAEDYIKCIKELQKDVPNLIIKNHILVGFPDETEEEFNESLELIYEAGCSETVPFIYTDRPKTPASAMDNKISGRLKKKRELRVRRAALLNKIIYDLKYLRGICRGQIKLA